MTGKNQSNIPAEAKLASLQADFEGYHRLMRRRISSVLLVASLYDAYLIEGEAHLTELILGEYIELNLSFAPRVHRVSSAEDALAALDGGEFDIVITMARVHDMTAVKLAEAVKKKIPALPVVLVSYNTRELSGIVEKSTPSPIDYAFVWQGDLKLLVAIMKLIEDRWNADSDVIGCGVQTVILIEDSVRFYSSYLPLIYTELMTQTQSLMAEGFNAAHRILRQAARPKILLATTYEDAHRDFEKYKANLLGIISDVSFPRAGQKDSQAGLDFIRAVRAEIPDIPAVLQSSVADNKSKADEAGAAFIYKNSATLLADLRNFIRENFGFGDFIFRTPSGEEVSRAADMKTMLEILPQIPDESFLYHARNNHFSKWLKARTEFELANILRPIAPEEFDTPEDGKAFLVRALDGFRRALKKGAVTDYAPGSYDESERFVRIGGGSLGGKAHNLAFINRFLEAEKFGAASSSILLTTPRSAFVGMEYFDRFMTSNKLAEIALSNAGDDDIKSAFLAAKLPDGLVAALKGYLEAARYPLAVRSSSLLEDSQYLPFAGVYSTIMLPNDSGNLEKRISELEDAIKLVYASTYFSRAKRYIESTANIIEEEKMAVIVQELVGRRYGRHFYPAISGAARSFNFYALDKIKPKDGVASIAIGLGRYVVEGGCAWRFSPKYAGSMPPYTSIESLAGGTQRKFLAVGLENDSVQPTGEDSYLEMLTIEDAEAHGTLELTGSTYDAAEDRLFDGISRKGLRIITFAHILKNNVFPLAKLLDGLLKLGKQAMGSEVEIEFAVNLPETPPKPAEFSLLQIRRLALEGFDREVGIDVADGSRAVVKSGRVLGNGIIENVRDIVYVKPGAMTDSASRKAAAEISALNSGTAISKTGYVLIGPGRWGSSDPWLGIPVQWADISGARVVVEAGMKGARVEPSQGSHFFHNITAYRTGYLTVGAEDEHGFIDWDWLSDQKAKQETEFVRHVRLSKPLVIKIDGLRGKAIISLPD